MTSQTDALLGLLLRLVQEHPSAKNQKGNPRLGINARVRPNSKRAKAIAMLRHLGLGTDPPPACALGLAPFLRPKLTLCLRGRGDAPNPRTSHRFHDCDCPFHGIGRLEAMENAP